ncbi:MAG TPA: MarR family winged helix-turn-helix transcriptional regulator [Stellaceae bacterium]|nr:MarR family winged helix-turn-helix transcriptional regulator [Stellaceae bacterium]
MSNANFVPLGTTLEVRNHCLCLHLQQAARAVARRFDEALRPFGLTSGQFSLLMSLNRAEPPTMGTVAAFLAMDRTTLTANLKPLARRCLVEITSDAADRRARRLRLTPAGHAALLAALPAWRRQHAAIDRLLPDEGDGLRAQLRALA